jgi:hypothetical protein
VQPQLWLVEISSLGTGKPRVFPRVLWRVGRPLPQPFTTPPYPTYLWEYTVMQRAKPTSSFIRDPQVPSHSWTATLLYATGVILLMEERQL